LASRTLIPFPSFLFFEEKKGETERKRFVSSDSDQTLLPSVSNQAATKRISFSFGYQLLGSWRLGQPRQAIRFNSPKKKNMKAS
jgi:hypothetical protein